MLNQACRDCLKWYKELNSKVIIGYKKDYHDTVIPNYCITNCTESQVPKYLHISQVVKWLEMKNNE